MFLLVSSPFLASIPGSCAPLEPGNEASPFHPLVLHSPPLAKKIEDLHSIINLECGCYDMRIQADDGGGLNYRISLYKGPGVYFLPATFDPALKQGRRLNGAGVYKRVLTRAYKN